MQPGDRLICALVVPRPPGYRFKDWPLHVTIVPWFRVGMSSEELAEDLRKQLVGSKPFVVAVGAEARFGYKERKQVNLVAAPLLMRLEGQTRRFLHAQEAWVVDEADQTRRGFRPHVTVQKNDRLQTGDTFQCDRLYVVAQHGGYKELEAEIIL